MEVSEEHLRQWRDFMEQVYIGTWEIQESLSNGNRAKVTTILEYLAANSFRLKAQLEKSEGMPSSPQRLLIDRLHNTEANQSYLAALEQALHMAHDVDAEQSEEDSPRSDVLQVLVADVKREISGLPPGYNGASLFAEQDADTA